jgi:uncharacterized protein
VATKKLLYLHGFNSSPKSEKAQKFKTYFNATNSYDVLVPELPPEPFDAIALSSELIASEAGIQGIIGSSLGGYYGLNLHAKFKLPLVLINPAAKPYLLLQAYIGENTNYYTGETYHVTPPHMEHLLALDVEDSELDMTRLFLLTQTQDEVLDYRDAALRLCRAKIDIQRGGDHSYQRFERRLPAIESFFRSFSE